MENNTFEEEIRTKDSADESLSQSEKLLYDISKVFDVADYKILPLFKTS